MVVRLLFEKVIDSLMVVPITPSGAVHGGGSDQ